MSVLELVAGPFAVTILDEPADAAPSREYAATSDLSAPDPWAAARHGVVCRGPDGQEFSRLLLAGGGASGVHDHSAVAVVDTLFVAVGDHIAALRLPNLAVAWAVPVDHATCFGVRHSSLRGCLVSHGEMEIARVSLAGEIVWVAGGADIFTGEFRLAGDVVEVSDFDSRSYRLDLATGRELPLPGERGTLALQR